jgi:hypothetical protein
MPDGAAHRFDDSLDTGNLSAANVNSLDPGGNVYEEQTALQVAVTAVRYVKQASLGGAWSIVDYAGATGQAVTASNTNYIYLAPAGTLTINTTGFPATQHLPLAEVVCDASAITSITDKRPHLTMPFWT